MFKMRVLKKFQGLSSNRYKNNPLERIFAEEWQKENTKLAVRNCTLDYLLSEDQNSLDIQDDETHQKIATIIQWLGSPVGQGFLGNVIERAMDKKIPMEMIAPLRGYMIPLYDGIGFFEQKKRFRK